MTKTYALRPDQIVPIAPKRGSCLATDRITVDGATVGYMVRDEPSDEYDSGWTFMAGDEDQAYLDDPDNLALYDVNTIANHDPDIVALLDAPIGSAFERAGPGEPLRPVQS